MAGLGSFDGCDVIQKGNLDFLLDVHKSEKKMSPVLIPEMVYT